MKIFGSSQGERASGGEKGWEKLRRRKNQRRKQIWCCSLRISKEVQRFSSSRIHHHHLQNFVSYFSAFKFQFLSMDAWGSLLCFYRSFLVDFLRFFWKITVLFEWVEVSGFSDNFKTNRDFLGVEKSVKLSFGVLPWGWVMSTLFSCKQCSYSFCFMFGKTGK